MATTPTVQRLSNGRLVITYANLLSENGGWVEAWEFNDKTIQATGLGTVTLQGSPDKTNAVALKDPQGVPISLAAASNQSAVVAENPRYIRAVNNDAGGAAITITCKS